VLAVLPSPHAYEVRPRADKRGFDLISEALPFGKLWYCKADDAVGYAKFTVAHIWRSFAYSMIRARWLKRTNYTALSASRDDASV
jgi:hypothetical protein